MAHYDHLLVLPGKAASAMGYGVAVSGDITTAEQLIPAANINAFVLGLSIATVGTTGIGMSYCRSGEAKGILAASAGPFALLGVASTNGALGPVVASGAGVAGTTRYQVGYCPVGGVAGQVVAVVLDPRQLV